MPSSPQSNPKPGATSNFHLSFLALPKDKRTAMADFYEFCRYADDVVDEIGPHEPLQARELLDALREEIERVFHGAPKTMLGAKLQELRSSFPVKKQNFFDIIDGCEMDLTKTRYQTFEELRQYCYRVASAVGLVSIEIFGYSSSSAQQYAVDLGLAFQLTNILRDIKEDGHRDRIYLPLEDLEKFQYTEEQLFKGDTSPAFLNLMTFECERAGNYYLEALDALSPTDRPNMKAAEIMASVYFDILRQIRAHPGRVFHERIRVSSPRKVWLGLRTWMNGKRPCTMMK